MTRRQTYNPLHQELSHVVAVVLLLVACACPGVAGAFSFGVNADNWKGELGRPGFAQAIKDLGVEFIVWHVSPEEVESDRIMEIVDFCRANKLAYLFNTELTNYVPGVPYFTNADGTYRWDLKPTTMERFKDDPLFLGQVYDEPMLMQSLNGVVVNGRRIPPYFVDTATMTPQQAFDAVAARIAEISTYHASYGKVAVFEMVLPDYAHAAARGGAILAPKLLKETCNDLMFSMYAGAARQYQQAELWACPDLWFLDRIPEKGKGGPGYHTPQHLYESLCYAYTQGFDRVYVEHLKGLVDLDTGLLTEYGRKVQAFHADRTDLPRRSWKEFEPQLVVKRFPDGYWGQQFSTFLPNYPYGSRQTTPALRQAADQWLLLLHTESKKVLPPNANNWNALRHPFFKNTPYFPLAGLPPMLVVDHTGGEASSIPAPRVVDLTAP